MFHGQNDPFGKILALFHTTQFFLCFVLFIRVYVGVRGFCICVCMQERVAHPHVWMAEDLVNLLLYHCLLYSLETKSLTEPRARLAAGKPQGWLTGVLRLEARLASLASQQTGRERRSTAGVQITLPWKSSWARPPWHCGQRLIVHFPAVQTQMISQNYINYNSLGISIASSYILN